jgi:hypothetical protein
MKKTAVEFLASVLSQSGPITKDDFDSLVKQARAMEKEQIIDAFEAAEKDCGRDFLHGDLYYNEIFKLKKKSYQDNMKQII